MSAIYKTIDVTHEGETKSLKLTFGLINAIENEVSLAGMVTEMNSGQIKMTKIAIVLEYIYRAAGFTSVTRDDMLLAVSSAGGKEFIELNGAVMAAAFPKQEETAKKK